MAKLATNSSSSKQIFDDAGKGELYESSEDVQDNKLTRSNSEPLKQKPNKVPKEVVKEIPNHLNLN